MIDNKKKKLALFDMDGTLLDTAEVNFLSYREAARKYGYEIERVRFMNEFGRNYKEFLPMFGVEDTHIQEKIHEDKKRLYPNYLASARLNQHLLNMMKSMHQEYMIALVTTASRKNVEDILESFQLMEQFDFLITQEDTVKLKPDPECYLVAMEKAGINPENTVIFEDSEVGIRAAEKSQAAVIQIRKF